MPMKSETMKGKRTVIATRDPAAVGPTRPEAMIRASALERCARCVIQKPAIDREPRHGRSRYVAEGSMTAPISRSTSTGDHAVSRKKCRCGMSEPRCTPGSSHALTAIAHVLRISEDEPGEKIGSHFPSPTGPGPAERLWRLAASP